MSRQADAAEQTPTPTSRRRVAFRAHQVAEYVVALALIAVGFHSSGGAEISLVTSGFLLAAVNLITSGPLGAFGVLSRRAHHLGDLVIAAALIVLPIVFSSHLHAAGIAISEAVAVLIVWMERSTSYAVTPPGGRRRADGEGASPAPSAAQAAGAAAAALPPEAARVAKIAAHRIGLVAGVTRRVVRERRKEAGARRT
jgi:hypothetical protein